MHALLASSSLCPVLLLLVHMLVFVVLVLFLMHAYARRRRTLGLSLPRTSKQANQTKKIV